jgi:hypothetical protein
MAKTILVETYDPENAFYHTLLDEPFVAASYSSEPTHGTP